MPGEVFNPKSPLLIHEHFRPHWCQAGAIVDMTFRTHDSIPLDVLHRWEREKQDWMHLGAGFARNTLQRVADALGKRLVFSLAEK